MKRALYADSPFIRCRECGKPFTSCPDGVARHWCAVPGERRAQERAAEDARKRHETGWEFDPTRGYS